MINITPKQQSNCFRLPPQPSMEPLIVEAGLAFEHRYKEVEAGGNIKACPQFYATVTRMHEAARATNSADVLLLHSKLRSINNEPLNLALDMFIADSALAGLEKAGDNFTALARALTKTSPTGQWARAQDAAQGFLNSHDTRHSFAILYGYQSLVFEAGSSETIGERLKILNQVLYLPSPTRTPIIRQLESDAAKYSAAAKPLDMTKLILGRNPVQGTKQDVLDALRICPQSLDFCTGNGFIEACLSAAAHLNTCVALLQRKRRPIQ